jgi:hypothetical protein
MFADFGAIRNAFKTLPGHERQFVPVSEYLYKELQPVADDVLFLGANYEAQFDRTELLIALECASSSGGWGPVGRFGWKHRSRRGLASPLDALIAEAEAAGGGWEPIQGGLFMGSLDKFREAAADLRTMIEGLPWI